VTSASADTMKTPTAVKSPTTATAMTTTLGKGSLWQPDDRDHADNYEKNSQESRYRHFSSLR